MNKTKVKILIKLVIIIFVGYLGVHKFIEKNTKMGWIYLFTCGLFGIGWFVDIVIAVKELFTIESQNTFSKSNDSINYGVTKTVKYPCHKVLYRKIVKSEILKRQPKEFVVFDTETTGLSPEDGNRIIEFCFLKYKDNVLIDKMMSLVNPECLLPSKIIKLTGINNEDLVDKPMMHEYIEEIINFINNQVVIGHNVMFDLKFLRSEIERCKFETEDLNIEYIDTLEIARNTIYLDNHKLETLKNHLGIQTTSHRADADCETTYEVYKHCLNMMIENEAQEQKRKENYNKRQQEKMANISDDEKRFIEFFINEATPYAKGSEIIYNFKSDNINFEINGMQIGRISLNDKNCEMQILTRNNVKWIKPITYDEAIKNVDKWIKYLKDLMQDK